MWHSSWAYQKIDDRRNLLEPGVVELKIEHLLNVSLMRPEEVDFVLWSPMAALRDPAWSSREI
jgi:hypothetical protein